jgi:hypothetical protein
VGPIHCGEKRTCHFFIRGQPILQSSGICMAGSVFRPVRQLNQGGSILHAAQLQDAGGPEDAGTVNTKKAPRIEFLLQRVHGFTQQMRTSSGVQLCIVTRRADPIRVFDRHNLNTQAGADGEPRNVLSGIACDAPYAGSFQPWNRNPSIDAPVEQLSSLRAT